MSKKIFVASFNRASDGALSKFVQRMKDNNLWIDDYSKADYFLAVADRIETYDFILQRFRENKPIIHLWAGEVSQGTHDEVYRWSMTHMSMMQLCTNEQAKKNVENINLPGWKPNAYVIGNIMLDNLEVSCPVMIKGVYPLMDQYDIVLYNPPTCLSEKETQQEIQSIVDMIDIKTIWIEPNGDRGSSLLRKHVTHKTFKRPEFLGLLKYCRRFITNSSCAFYEAPFLMDKKNIIMIGERNKERESKYTKMDKIGDTDKVIELLKGL